MYGLLPVRNNVSKRETSDEKTFEFEVIPVFLADPCTPAPTVPLPGLPGAPVFLLKRLLKKLASTPSLAAPAAKETRKLKSLQKISLVVTNVKDMSINPYNKVENKTNLQL